MYSRLLRNISGIGGLVNIQYLRLQGCPELEMLPSFAKLASLKVFLLKGSNKVETIRGLQLCTSLETLEIEGGKCWDVSDIESWEHLQRLKIVQLTAKKRSTLLPCIQTIQKWPEEMIICTKAVGDAGSLLESSAFPNLFDVKFFAKKKLKRIKRSSDGKAMIVCCVIKCKSPTTLIVDGAPNVRRDLELEAGKWTWMGVFTKHSRFLIAREWRLRSRTSSEEYEVEEGMVGRGEEESVVEAFHRLLALLAA